MTTKQWLRRPWKYKEEIRALQKARDSIYQVLTSTTVTPGGEAVSHSSDPHKMDRLPEIDNAIAEATVELTQTYDEVLHAVLRVQDRRRRMVLLYRYTSFMTWEQIAVTMHYGYRQVLRIHDEALQDMAGILKDVI